MSLPSLHRLALAVTLLFAVRVACHGADALASAGDLRLAHQFDRTVQPFLQTYCVSCHGKEKTEAELDLTPFSTVASIVNGFSYWELVLERLEAGEMPPEKAKTHPTDAQREEIVKWVHALRQSEAAKNAGDPGPVLARRLSNAEYDYTIRDLTGVDIRPTREFPVDPANQAGFPNSGESLAMSPSLVKKYLGAARTVAEHLVLKPDGFEFAPHPVVADTDHDKWGVLRIVDFYRRQPVDLADYFSAAWRHQHRARLGRPDATLAEAAAEAKVSATYLATLWPLLTIDEAVGPFAKLQAMWRALPAPAAVGSESDVRAGCRAMSDFVVNLRAKIVPEVKNLTAPGIQNGSQTLVMWKNRQMAANRRTFDPAALQIDGAPLPAPEKPVAAARAPKKETPAASNNSAPSPNGQPVTPRPATPQNPPSTPDIVRKGGKFLAPAILTTGSSATFKMAAARKRGVDPDLIVPADRAERARHEAEFARFAAVFPDAFFITERARVYLDAEKEQGNAGRLLSAGLHSMTGYFRDDGPLYDLILDDAGRRELDRIW
jgi:cytochrome c553